MTSYIKTLLSGQLLNINDTLNSTKGEFQLIMQHDGNLCVNRTKDKVCTWSSKTDQTPSTQAKLNADGSFQVIESNGNIRWTARTEGNSGAVLNLSDDGQLVIALNGETIWSSSYLENLNPGEILAVRNALVSADGNYKLEVNASGNLCLVHTPNSQTIWSANTEGENNKAVLEKEGNLAVYNTKGKALWSSGTGSDSGVKLNLQNDGSLGIYGGYKIIWGPHILTPEQKLKPGQSLVSPNGTYHLNFQEDGDLVLCKTSDPKTSLWSSGTKGKASFKAIVQRDGNFVIYDASTTALWSTGVEKSGSRIDAWLMLQNDGNLVVYEPNTSYKDGEWNSLRDEFMRYSKNCDADVVDDDEASPRIDTTNHA